MFAPVSDDEWSKYRVPGLTAGASGRLYHNPACRSADLFSHRLTTLFRQATYNQAAEGKAGTAPRFHPDGMKGPMNWLFEREFQGWLNDFAERTARYGGRRQTLHEYKKTT